MTEKEFLEHYRKFKSGDLSEAENIKDFKVDNAIIMAAGFGLRSLPLSRYLPKGLFEVRGEILIERQIEQLLESGIKEIIVVVGYLKEKFAYLKEKYDVIIIENDDYYRYNNISSIYAAKEYLKNSYICCSDNYFNKNVFEPYVFDSYYSCLYSEGYADEYCITKEHDGYIKEIKKGYSDAWYTIGEAYFSRNFSEKFLQFLEEEYAESDTKRMLWDDFHMKHMSDLPMRYYKYDNETVQEFDSIDDILKFDSEFETYRGKVLEEEGKKEKDLPTAFGRYAGIERYDSTTTNQHFGRLHLNENPYGPSPMCLEVLKNISNEDLLEYDMSSNDFLTEDISKRFSIPKDDIFVHNGSAEIIRTVFSIVVEKDDYVLLPDPGWSYYTSLAHENFAKIEKYNLIEDDYTYRFTTADLIEKTKRFQPKVIAIMSPNNPVGCKLDGESLELILRENPNSLILFDEAYWGFSEEDIDIRRLVESYSNLIITRTFSKYYGLANIRIGFGFCNYSVRHIYGLGLPLFRESGISRKIASAAIKDTEYYEKITKTICDEREWFADEINKIQGLRAFQSDANFLVVDFGMHDPYEIQKDLKDNGILIRLLKNDKKILSRITIGKHNDMEKCIDVIKKTV